MTAPLLPLQQARANRPTTRAAAIKWLGALLVIWAVVGWVRFSGFIPSASKFNEIDDPTPDHSTAGTGQHVETSSELESPPPATVPAVITKHTDRVAVIVEDRPLGNLAPIILHFHSVLGPEWPVILYTSRRTADVLLRSAALSRAVASSDVEIRYLPANTTFDTHASVSAFLAAPFLWADLAPYGHVLLFQADSVVCAASGRRADDFLAHDLVGAPVDARLGAGFNGGLSLRDRRTVLRVLARWDFAADAADPRAPREWRFEDQWFYVRMRELAAEDDVDGGGGGGDDGGGEGEGTGVRRRRINLPDVRTAAGFAVETVWVEGQMPLGFHQPHRWQGDRMDEIMAYCPEVGMIAGSSFF